MSAARFGEKTSHPCIDCTLSGLLAQGMDRTQYRNPAFQMTSNGPTCCKWKLALAKNVACVSESLNLTRASYARSCRSIFPLLAYRDDRTGCLCAWFIKSPEPRPWASPCSRRGAVSL